MRNLNQSRERVFVVSIRSFILTMRNLNYVWGGGRTEADVVLY